jgi:hypothetical protein
MRRGYVLGLTTALALTGVARMAEAGSLAPLVTVEDAGRKNHVITILGAHLVMVAGLERANVVPAMTALDRHLEARLRAGQPAVVYPEVVLSIVKAAVLRGFSAADTATVLIAALRKIDEGRSPEMTRQKVVLAIVRNEKGAAVLASLAADPPASSPE